MSGSTRRDRAKKEKEKERLKRWGPKVRLRNRFRHTAVLPKDQRSTTLHPFSGRHRAARVLKFQALQRSKKAVRKSRAQVRKASQRRNRG